MTDQLKTLQTQIDAANSAIQKAAVQPASPDAQASLKASVDALEKSVASLNDSLARPNNTETANSQAISLMQSLKSVADLTLARANELKQQMTDQASAQSAQAFAQSNMMARAFVGVAQSQSQSRKPTGQPALADYVPCRFTNDQERALRQGFTPIPTGGQDDKQTLLNFASQPNSGIASANVAAFQSLVNAQDDGYAALLLALDQQLITPDGAVRAAQALQGAQPAAPAPNDVACSEAVLTWEQTRWIFGRKIADNYVAIQVTARNLNGDQEFLIHDLQVAVAAFAPSSAPQPGGAPATVGLYGSGVNGAQGGAGKTVAEGCAAPTAKPGHTHFVAGQDRVLVRGVGETGQKFTARNVSGRLLETLGSIFGAAALVAGGPSFGPAVHIFNAAAIPGFNNVLPDLTGDQLNRLNDLGFSSSSAYKIVIPKNGSVPMTTFLPSAIFADNFRNWDHCKLLNFQEGMVVVLGGKHILEQNNTPQLAKVDCPLNGGLLDLTKATGDNFQCNVSGTTLSSLTSVRLKNADDATDKATIDGTLNIPAGGPGTSGTVVFSVKALNGLAGNNYTAFGESASAESASSSKLSLPPAVSAVSPTSIALSGANPCAGPVCAVTITGTHLAVVTEARLVAPDGTPISRVAIANPTATSATANFQLQDLKSANLKQSTACNLVLVTAGTATFATGTQVSIAP